MALDQKLKVIFQQVTVKDVGTLWGPGQWFFKITVNGKTIGDASAKFKVKKGDVIKLPASWLSEVDVSALNQVNIEFTAFASRPLLDKQMGKISIVLNYPFSQGPRNGGNKYFFLDCSVQLSVGGTFAAHNANEIFASRLTGGQHICTTVSGARVASRIEFCEVRPTPPAASMPPRPSFSAAVAAENTNTAGNPTVNPADPLNIIPNPPVIPIIDKANATNQNAARIEYTYYRPGTLNFTDTDKRLVWTVVSLDGKGQADFVGGNNGIKIFVYGTAEGEVELQVRFNGALAATYRALVLPIKHVVCRFNILNGPNRASTPRATPNDVFAHYEIANRFLYQLGILLQLDTDKTRKDGATATNHSGIFRIRVGAGVTRRISLATTHPGCVQLNYRPGVMNFAYIRNTQAPAGGGAILGAATHRPASAAGLSITDKGSPSTSWKQPSGIPPDGDAGTITMTLLPASLKAGHPQLFGMYITNDNGNSSQLADQQTFAGTIAHELGHVLSLRHRVGAAMTPCYFPPTKI